MQTPRSERYKPRIIPYHVQVLLTGFAGVVSSQNLRLTLAAESWESLRAEAGADRWTNYNESVLVVFPPVGAGRIFREGH